MDICKIEYNGDIIFIVKNSIDSVVISTDTIRKDTGSVLLHVILKNSNHTFRFMDINKAMLVSKVLLEEGSNEISI